MLDKIRNNVVHSGFVKILLVVSTLAFVAWGMGTSNNLLRKNYAIKVGNIEISAQEYHRMYYAAKQNLARQMQAQLGGANLPASLMQLFEGQLKPQVNNQLISQAQIVNFAENNDIFVGSDIIFNMLQKDPNFQTDGEFDKDKYVSVLKQAGLSPLQFENEIAKNMQNVLITHMFRNATLISNQELDSQIKYQQERRDVGLLTLNSKDVLPLPKATEKDLKEIYEEKQADFIIPEKRDLSVMMLSRVDFAKKVNITDSEVKNYYENNKDQFLTKAEYKVAQILVEDEKTVNKVLAHKDLSKNFVKYVKQYSTDSSSKLQNGDMGWLTADVFSDEVAQIIHSTEKGKVALKAAKTPFGYHIFKVLDIKEPKAKSFAEVKDKIKATIQQEKADELFNAKLDEVYDMVAEGQLLEDIASALNLTTKKLHNQEASSKLDYVKSAFALELDEVSEPIELGLDTTVFVQVIKVTEESTKAFEDVQKELFSIFKEKKTQELLTAKADDILAKIESGSSFKELAKEFGLVKPVQLIKGIQRTGNSAENIQDSISEEVFKAEVGTKIQKVMENNRDLVFVSVLKSYQEPISATDTEVAKQKLIKEKTDDLYSSLLSDLTVNVTPDINDSLIDNIIKNVK